MSRSEERRSMMIETGCIIHDRQDWISQVHALVTFAKGMGWEDPDEEGTRLLMNSSPDPRDAPQAARLLEELTELGDEIEGWLNDNRTNGECSYGWRDGEFWYMPGSWWAEG